MEGFGLAVRLIDVLSKFTQIFEHGAGVAHDGIVGEREQKGCDKADVDEPDCTDDQRDTEDPAPQVVLQLLLVDGFSLLFLRERSFGDGCAFGIDGFRIGSDIIFHPFPPYFFISRR